MSIPTSQVDAFTSEPFAGNPAAVCLLPSGPHADETWMQSVAAEMNLSETAFVTPRDDGFSLRWFTPVTEVDLCGHATLAAAHALWEHGALRLDEEARFHTASGLLTATTGGGWITLDFPALPSEAAEAPDSLLGALGVAAEAAFRSRFDWLIEVASEDVVRSIAPDFVALRGMDARGVIVTARGDDAKVDFVSRFFAPAAGIDEDPVTGSAHCVLGPHWAHTLGQTTLMARQISSRGGVLRVDVMGDRVGLSGQAVTVLEGILRA